MTPATLKAMMDEISADIALFEAQGMPLPDKEAHGLWLAAWRDAAEIWAREEMAANRDAERLL